MVLPVGNAFENVFENGGGGVDESTGERRPHCSSGATECLAECARRRCDAFFEGVRIDWTAAAVPGATDGARPHRCRGPHSWSARSVRPGRLRPARPDPACRSRRREPNGAGWPARCGRARALPARSGRAGWIRLSAAGRPVRPAGTASSGARCGIGRSCLDIRGGSVRPPLSERVGRPGHGRRGAGVGRSQQRPCTSRSAEHPGDGVRPVSRTRNGGRWFHGLLGTASAW